jgi:hexosaminidase
MGRVTAAGYHAVLSAPFYLNYISYGSDWPKYYQVEPTAFPSSDPQAKVSGFHAHILIQIFLLSALGT